MQHLLMIRVLSSSHHQILGCHDSWQAFYPFLSSQRWTGSCRQRDRPNQHGKKHRCVAADGSGGFKQGNRCQGDSEPSNRQRTLRWSGFGALRKDYGARGILSLPSWGEVAARACAWHSKTYSSRNCDRGAGMRDSSQIHHSFVCCPSRPWSVCTLNSIHDILQLQSLPFRPLKCNEHYIR